MKYTFATSIFFKNVFINETRVNRHFLLNICPNVSGQGKNESEIKFRTRSIGGRCTKRYHRSRLVRARRVVLLGIVDPTVYSPRTLHPSTGFRACTQRTEVIKFRPAQGTLKEFLSFSNWYRSLRKVAA